MEEAVRSVSTHSPTTEHTPQAQADGQPEPLPTDHEDAAQTSTPDQQPHNHPPLLYPHLAADDILTIMDLAGVVLVGSAATAHRFGRTQSEYVGSVVWDLMPPEVAEYRRSKVAEAVSTEQPVRFVDQRAGSWVDTTYTPLFNEKGEVHQIAVTGRDVTGLKLQKEQLSKQRL